MIHFRINQAKGLFFDRKAVTTAVNRAERRVLSRFGAFVRRGARSSIRKRRRASARGSPPSSHTGLLKRNIFFVYEPLRSSVIIGPVKLNKGTDAPEVLEHGGRVVRRVNGKKVRVTYKPRPYMGPAYAKERPKLSSMWKNSVR